MIRLSLIGILLFAAKAFAVRGGCGNEIVFNCDTHTVLFNGSTTPIDCGKITWSKSGIIGQPGRGAGSVYKSMKGAPLVTMIPTPTSSGRGNVVVHLVPPKNGRCPVGHSRSAGCIHVCPDVLTKLSRCYGTPYKVIFSGRGKMRYSSPPTPRQQIARQPPADWQAKTHQRSQERRQQIPGILSWWQKFLRGGQGSGASQNFDPYESRSGR